MSEREHTPKGGRTHFSHIIFVAIDSMTRRSLVVCVTRATHAESPNDADYADAKEAAIWQLRAVTPRVEKIERARTIYLGVMTAKEAAEVKPPNLSKFRHSTDGTSARMGKVLEVGVCLSILAVIFAVFFGIPACGLHKAKEEVAQSRATDALRVITEAVATLHSEGRFVFIHQTPYYRKGAPDEPGLIAVNPAMAGKSSLITLYALGDGIHLPGGSLFKVAGLPNAPELAKAVRVTFAEGKPPVVTAATQP